MTGQVGSDLAAGAEERQQWIGHDPTAVDLEGQIEAFALGSLEESNGGRRIRCHLRQAGDALNHQQLVDKVRDGATNQALDGSPASVSSARG